MKDSSLNLCGRREDKKWRDLEKNVTQEAHIDSRGSEDHNHLHLPQCKRDHNSGSHHTERVDQILCEACQSARSALLINHLIKVTGYRPGISKKEKGGVMPGSNNDFEGSGALNAVR